MFVIARSPLGNTSEIDDDCNNRWMMRYMRSVSSYADEPFQQQKKRGEIVFLVDA